MFRQLALLVLVLATGTAFQVQAPALHSRIQLSSSTARQVLLSEEETQSIIQSAQECAAGECSIDDVSDLISELREQEKILSARLESVMNMISDLQYINEKEERQTDEVRAFVSDMLRVFSLTRGSETQSLATGFSGDISKGTKTAYDSLNPKPWKPKGN
ncbi:hypothetical protein MPSEU_000895500 [Mayamaea pseudoterrestris]|nr:hypothetical protein MPSEU_000895500 [Mayamaea pseudoterrestris]